MKKACASLTLFVVSMALYSCEANYNAYNGPNEPGVQPVNPGEPVPPRALDILISFENSPYLLAYMDAFEKSIENFLAALKGRAVTFNASVLSSSEDGGGGYRSRIHSFTNSTDPNPGRIIRRALSSLRSKPPQENSIPLGIFEMAILDGGNGLMGISNNYTYDRFYIVFGRGQQGPTAGEDKNVDHFDRALELQYSGNGLRWTLAVIGGEGSCEGKLMPKTESRLVARKKGVFISLCDTAYHERLLEAATTF